MPRNQQPQPPPVLPPLQRTLRDAVNQALGHRALSASANAGLVFERYAKLWETHTDLPTPAKSARRTRWVIDFARDFASQRAAGSAVLTRQLARLERIAHEHRDFEPVGPFVTGMGADHPLENGFSFEHNLGLPVIPGSSVKGLVRAGAKALGSEQEVVTRLLGSEAPGRRDRKERHAPTSPGRVAFLDAWPTRWPQLDADLINPHHPSYTQDQSHPIVPREREHPRAKVADLTEEPKPVSFLVVGPGTPYRFSVRWLTRRPGTITAEDRALVWRWLEVGLVYLGIGAKTGAGYGHMALQQSDPS